MRFSQHRGGEDQQDEQDRAGRGKKPNEWRIFRSICMLVIMVMTSGRDLFFGHLRSIFVVRVSVCRIERFFQRNTAFARERKGIRSTRDDLIAGE